MGYAFLSYERSDQGYIVRLAAEAKRLGIEAWFDTDIESGARWAEVIEARVRGCDAFAPLVTPGSRASAWCQRELLLADQLGKPLLPLVRRGTDIPMLLIDRQYEDITSDRLPGERWFQAVRQHLIDRPPGPPNWNVVASPTEQTTDIGRSAERPYASIQRDSDDESPRADPVVSLDAPTIFLCHVHEDAAFANELSDRLRKEGLNVWSDEDDLRGGHEWHDAIERVLEEVDYVVVLQSESLQAKVIGYVNRELSLALDRQLRYRPPRIFVIPTIIDSWDSRLDELADLQSVDLTTPEGIDSLLKMISRDRSLARQSGR